MKELLSFIIILFVLVSCTAKNNIKNEQQYTDARYTFNDLIEEYMVFYRKANFDEQLRLKTDFEPQLSKITLALFSWKIAILLSRHDKVFKREREYLLVNNKLLDMIKDYEHNKRNRKQKKTQRRLRVTIIH